MKFYFTFGQNHVHPKTGEKLKDYWIEVVAADEIIARQWMFDNFGAKWSFCYTEETFEAHYFPYGRYGEIINLCL